MSVRVPPLRADGVVHQQGSWGACSWFVPLDVRTHTGPGYLAAPGGSTTPSSACLSPPLTITCSALVQPLGVTSMCSTNPRRPSWRRLESGPRAPPARRHPATGPCLQRAPKITSSSQRAGRQQGGQGPAIICLYGVCDMLLCLHDIHMIRPRAASLIKNPCNILFSSFY